MLNPIIQINADHLVSKVMDLSPRVVYQPFLSFWYANPKWASDRDTLRVFYRTGKNARWKLLSEYSHYRRYGQCCATGQRGHAQSHEGL